MCPAMEHNGNVQLLTPLHMSQDVAHLQVLPTEKKQHLEFVWESKG